jgi:hypothetical protein
MLSFLGFTVENNKHHAVLFCVGQEGGLVEDTLTAVVMEEWGRLGVGAGGPQRRRPLAEALRLREGGAHGETTRDEGSRNLTAVPFSGRSDQDQTVANTR